MNAEIDRCDRELAAMAEGSTHRALPPAWLVTLGQFDWLIERELILLESEP